jgi:hypothetical protein
MAASGSENGSDNFERGPVQVDNQSQVETQGAENTGKEVEDDHDGSEDEDNDEGTRTY